MISTDLATKISDEFRIIGGPQLSFKQAKHMTLIESNDFPTYGITKGNVTYIAQTTSDGKSVRVRTIIW